MYMYVRLFFCLIKMLRIPSKSTSVNSGPSVAIFIKCSRFELISGCPNYSRMFCGKVQSCGCPNYSRVFYACANYFRMAISISRMPQNQFQSIYFSNISGGARVGCALAPCQRQTLHA